MVLDSLKRARGERHVKQLLKGQYEGEELETLASTLYPISDRIGEVGLEQVIGLSSQLTRYSEKKAVRLLELAPEIIERLLTCGDAELVLLVYALAQKVAGDTTFVAARLLEESLDTLEHVLVYGDLELAKRVVKLCIQVAEANGGTAVRLFELSPELIETVGYADLEKVAELSARVARDNSFVAARMLGMSAELIDRLGYDGLQDVVALSMESAQVNRSIAVRLLEQSPALIDRVGYDGLKELAELSHQVARYNWRTAVTLLGMGPELIDRVGYTGLEALALLCSVIARDDSFVAARLLEMSPELIDKVGSDCLKKLAYLTTEVNKDDGFIAAKVLDESPELIAKVLLYGDDELMTSVYALCCQVSDNVNWRTAVRLLGETPELVRRLHSYGDTELVKNVYMLCNRIALQSGSTAVSLLEQSPALVDRVGYEGFEEVATRAAELTGIDEGRATSFVRGESTESAQFMETIARGLELKRIKHILATYLNALLGYQIELVEAQGASTDGKRIFLPEYLEEFSDEARNFTLYKVLATHEEAHLEYGSFDFELVTVSDLVSNLRAKYGERIRMIVRSDLEQFFACFPDPALARDLTTILEDFRITARLQAEYPVLGEQIIAMNGHMVTKRPPLAALATDRQRAVELLGQSLTAGWTKEKVPVTIAAVLDQAISRSQPLTSPQADVHETARVAADVYTLIDGRIPGPYESLPPFSAPLDQSKVEETIGNFNRAARKISEKLERQERTGEQQSSGQEQFGQLIEEPAERSEQQQASEERVKHLLRTLFKETGVTPRAVESEIDALELNRLSAYLSDLETVIREGNALQKEHGTFLYHEWGIDIGDYRPNWTRVREQQLTGGSTDFYRATVQKYGGLIKCIRREFQMLRPEGVINVREQFEGEDIDLDAAVQYFIDKRLRLSPSERNYVRTEKRTRDITVAFLVDVSGSTSGATLTCEKEALIVMSEALEELGDAFAIYCFSGYGRDNSLFYTVKEFEDSYDERVQSKISQLRSQRSTRIAPAIRHTTLKLRGREEKTRLLILLSDGKPLDLEYHGDYAIEDTRMALREAGRYGIKSFCITVDREAAEYLPRMYANSRWVVIDEVAKLPNKITRIYRLFTT